MSRALIIINSTRKRTRTYNNTSSKPKSNYSSIASNAVKALSKASCARKSIRGKAPRKGIAEIKL